MAEESPRADDFEVYCVFCNKPLSEEDEIHFTLGPFGYDFDVMCGECMQRSRRSPAGDPLSSQGIGNDLDLGQSADALDLLADAEWGHTPDI